MGWVFALLGVVVIISAFALTRIRGSLSSSWHTTQGIITSSEGWEAILSSGNVPVAKVKFKYQVAGISYEGQQSWAHGPAPPKPGSAVTVYYDPAKPQKSAVAPFATSNNLVLLMYFLVLLAIGLFAAALAQLF